MNKKSLIPADKLCSHYNIEVSFIQTLDKMGLLRIEIVEQSYFIHQDQVGDLEKIMRLHNELNVNLEGIDVVLNLLEKEKELKRELTALKNRLRLYESEE